MGCFIRGLAKFRPLCLLAGLITLPASWATADVVWLKSGKGNAVALENVKVVGVQNGSLAFTTASGNQTSRSLDVVPRIKLDDDPAFSAAEDAFDRGDWAAAADGYRKVLAGATRDWVKDRASLRALQAADKSGNFPAAVAGFVELLQTNFALANDHKPAIPKNKPEALDPAIAQVKQAAGNPRLGNEQKTVLLNYLMEMYTARGDTASARGVLQQLGKVAPADLNSPEARKLQADVKLAEARQAFGDKQYARAIQTLEASSGLFGDSQQQADALYLIAQAREAGAKPDDADQLKDAAIAYMRVVASFKGVAGAPHVAEAMLRTAGIEEKLKNPQEALALYKQVASEFKGSPEATQAEQAVARLGNAKG